MIKANIDFSANKRPAEVIKKGHLDELILEIRDIYSGINGKWYGK